MPCWPASTEADDNELLSQLEIYSLFSVAGSASQPSWRPLQTGTCKLCRGSSKQGQTWQPVARWSNKAKAKLAVTGELGGQGRRGHSSPLCLSARPPTGRPNPPQGRSLSVCHHQQASLFPALLILPCQPLCALNPDTGWSKETVNCNFFVTGPKITKSGITEPFLVGAHREVLIFCCLKGVRWKNLTF